MSFSETQTVPSPREHSTTATVSEPRSSDAAVIDLLRIRDALGISELAESLGVTPTAVRQRLERLMRDGIVERSTVSKPRGRPAHAYRLTAAGHRIGGDNFRDLALVLWREIRGIRDPAVRSGLLGRIGAALAEAYRPAIRGGAVSERLESVAALLRERDICCSVTAATVDTAKGDERLPVLTSHACPYPDLAEEDRGICAAERLMLQDLVGADVRLAECRLDGGSVCRFVAGTHETVAADVAEAVNETVNQIVAPEQAGRADAGGCRSGGERVECEPVSLSESGGSAAGSDVLPLPSHVSSSRSRSP